MKIARSAVLLISLIGALSVWSAPRDKVAIITSDADPRINQLWMETDESGQALKVVSIDAEGDIRQGEVEELKKGIVLMHKSGMNIVVIRSPDFDPYTGGNLDLDYLHNALSGKRHVVRIQVVFADGTWQLRYKNLPVRRIHVLANRFLGKVVGIDRLRFYQSWDYKKICRRSVLTRALCSFNPSSSLCTCLH